MGDQEGLYASSYNMLSVLHTCSLPCTCALPATFLQLQPGLCVVSPSEQIQFSEKAKILMRITTLCSLAKKQITDLLLNMFEVIFH